jgi:N-acetylneuraminate lyase
MRLDGLIAAVHSPFDSQAELNLLAVEGQAQLMASQGVSGVFICGSTGESHSLSVGERMALGDRWLQVLQGSSIQPIIHVGSNSLRDSRQLAAHAEKIGAVAISAQAPSYFRPRNVSELCDWCVQIAAAAPRTPFYFYDIPVMTGVNLSMPDFLQLAGSRIPNLRGLKFTNQDLMSFQICQRLEGGRFDIAFGVDEMLLAALCLGATGAVGSSYNFAAPIYLRLIAAFQRGDLQAAREEQYRSVQLIRLLAATGYMSSAREVMGWLGAPVGAPRQPHVPLTAEASAGLRRGLEELGFFDWVRAV